MEISDFKVGDTILIIRDVSFYHIKKGTTYTIEDIVSNTLRAFRGGHINLKVEGERNDSLVLFDDEVAKVNPETARLLYGK